MSKSELAGMLAVKLAASTVKPVAITRITNDTKFQGSELTTVWFDEAIELPPPRRGPDDGSKETMREYDDYG